MKFGAARRRFEKFRSDLLKTTNDIAPKSRRRLYHHRQPNRTMSGFGLQRSFGRNIRELLVYYLMPKKCKNLKDTKSSCLSICNSIL